MTSVSPTASATTSVSVPVALPAPVVVKSVPVASVVSAPATETRVTIRSATVTKRNGIAYGPTEAAPG
jgi:hypothetical protein